MGYNWNPFHDVSELVGDISGGNNAQGAYNKAGAGMRDLAGQAKGFGQQQQDYYTGGMNQALGYYNPAASYAGMMAGQGQGYGEQAFNNVGQQMLGGPRNSQNFYANQQQGPGSGESYFAGTQAQYGTPTEAWRNYSPDAYKTNTMQDAYGGLSQRMGNSTLARDLPTYQNQLSGATGLERQQGQIGAAYTDNTIQRDTGNYKDILGAQGQQSWNAQTGALNRLGGATQTQQEYGNIKGLESGANYGRQAYAQQQGQLQGPGQFEKFAAQAAAGPQYDPTYQRESQLGRESIDAEMNARGAYNSGAALKSLGNFEGDLRAKQYAQVAGLTQNAQQAQMQRLAQQMQGAGQATGEQMAQAQGLQSLAGQTQQEKIGTGGQESNIVGARQAGGLANTQAMLGMDQAAAADRRANAQGMQGLLSATDQQRYDRTMAGANLGIQGDQADLARTQGLANLANMTSGQNLAYLGAGQNAAQGVDQGMLAKLMGGQQSADSAQAAGLNRTNSLYGMASGIDQQTMAGLQGYLGAAAGTQGLQQARQQQALAALMGVGGAQSGLTMQGYQMGGQSMQDMLNNYLTLIGQGYTLPAQGALANTQARTGLEQGAVNAYASKGGR